MEVEVLSSLKEPSANRLTTFNSYALHEKEVYSWASTGRQLYEDYDYAAGNTKNYTLSLPGIVSEDSVWLTTVFAARSIGASTYYSVAVNGKTRGNASTGIHIFRQSILHKSYLRLHKYFLAGHRVGEYCSDRYPYPPFRDIGASGLYCFELYPLAYAECSLPYFPFFGLHQ